VLTFVVPWSARYHASQASYISIFIFLQALYNNKGYHSQPVFLNAMDNAILRHYLPGPENPGAYGESNKGWSLLDL
jgi:hypothetical protein